MFLQMAIAKPRAGGIRVLAIKAGLRRIAAAGRGWPANSLLAVAIIVAGVGQHYLDCNVAVC